MLELLKSVFWKNAEKTFVPRAAADQELGVHTIFIETISKCNLRCTYCHRTTNNYSSKNKKMSFEVFQKVIDQIDIQDPIFQQDARPLQKNRPCLYLHGYGEPTLHPELTAQIAYASKSGKFHEIRFVSNLLAVPTEKYHDYFVAGLTHMYVSLDTLDPKEIEQTRVGTDVKRLDETFTYLARHYGDRIRVITVLSQANKTLLPVLHDYLGQHGIKEWVIQLMLDHDTHEFAVQAAEADAVGATLDKSKYDMRIFLEGHPYPKCTQPFDTIVINVLGHVAACCTYFSNDYIDFGQVAEQPLLEIFKSEKFKAFRETFKQHPPPLCRDCPLY